ncbi:hypothetical protein BJ166DRAFT_510610 [Pestalotiopsis sp. NC0098]|nr:hypothetical protein BJ166DRAFT_510610 [Pestalotiopsis sp. NC0098]
MSSMSPACLILLALVCHSASALVVPGAYPGACLRLQPRSGLGHSHATKTPLFLGFLGISFGSNSHQVKAHQNNLHND